MPPNEEENVTVDIVTVTWKESRLEHCVQHGAVEINDTPICGSCC